MNTIIARTSFFGQKPGKERFEITVEIGTPYPWNNKSDEWACPVAVKPLYEDLRDAHGNDSLQALCLAIALAQDLLDGFREQGGILILEDGSEFPLESYSFGIARRSR